MNAVQKLLTQSELTVTKPLVEVFWGCLTSSKGQKGCEDLTHIYVAAISMHMVFYAIFCMQTMLWIKPMGGRTQKAVDESSH